MISLLFKTIAFLHLPPIYEQNDTIHCRSFHCPKSKRIIMKPSFAIKFFTLLFNCVPTNKSELKAFIVRKLPPANNLSTNYIIIGKVFFILFVFFYVRSLWSRYKNIMHLLYTCMMWYKEILYVCTSNIVFVKTCRDRVN